MAEEKVVAEKGNIGYGILGFFFPLVGLILFLVWKDTKPADSKVSGIGALIGFCASIVFYIIYFILIAALASSGNL